MKINCPHLPGFKSAALIKEEHNRAFREREREEKKQIQKKKRRKVRS